MRAKIFIALFLIASISTSFNVYAKGGLDEKIDELQRQIDQLKEAQKQGDGKTHVKARLPVELYGFMAGQLFWGTAKTQMYGGLNSMAAQSRVADKAVTGEENTWFGITPQNSRVGLRWNKTKVSEKVSMGGVLELDFVNILNSTSYGTSPIPRIRLFSFELMGDRWSLMAGQNWDIFSPFNTNSLSLGQNLWYQGNMGFRRPQLRFTYDIPLSDTDGLKAAISANHPANTDDLMNSDGMDSGLPHGEGLIQYKRKLKSGDLIAALSGVVGANSVTGSYTTTAGIAGSLAIPFHRLLKLAGEIQWGQDLGIFLSYVGAGAKNKDLAAWWQISSGWCEKFETNVGYGIDDISSSKVAAGGITRNQAFFGNFKFFPVKPFYFGVEYEYLRTTYKVNGPSSTNVVMTNFVYNF